MDEDFVGSLIGGGTITLDQLVTNAATIVKAAGSTYSTLSEDFGYVIYIPVTLAVVSALIGIVKGIMFFRRRRRQ